MLRKLLAAMLAIACLQPTFAQEEEKLDDEPSYSVPSKRFALGVTCGIGGLVVRDRVISNYLYSGSYVPLGLHFEMRGKDRKSFISLEFSNRPELKTKTNEGFSYSGEYGEFYPDETDGLDFQTLKTYKWRFQTGALYLLKSTEHKRFLTYLGYDLSANSFGKEFLQFEYVNKLQDQVLSAGFAFGLDRHFNEKHHLEYYLSLPILSHARRSLTNPDADPTTVTESKFTILASVLGFDSRFTYRIQMSERFSLRATYSFQYLQVTFPEKEQWAYNQLVAGLFFHF